MDDRYRGFNISISHHKGFVNDKPFDFIPGPGRADHVHKIYVEHGKIVRDHWIWEPDPLPF